MKKILFFVCLVFLSLNFNLFAADANKNYLEAKKCYQDLQADRAKNTKGSEWKKCINLFENIAKNNPKSEKADDALYSAARLNRELYLATKDIGQINDSIHLYNQVVKDYPKSSLADDALFQIALLRHDPLKENDKATNALNALIERYPEGDMASKAKTLLAAFGPNKTEEEKNLEQEAVAEEAGKLEKESFKKVPEPDKDDPFTQSILKNYELVVNNDFTQITFNFDQEMAFTREFIEQGKRTKSPAVLIIDFPQTDLLEEVIKEKKITSPHLRSIKIKDNFFTGNTKIKFKLGKNSTYKISRNKNTVVVSFFTKGNNPDLAVKEEKPALTRMLNIVIDPGHGGDDEGAIGPNGTKEKDITLAISKKLAQVLKEKIKSKVYLTRAIDKTLTLEDRNKMASDVKADIFISIHVNAVKDHSINGIETYYLNNATDEAAGRLAKRENMASSKPQNEVDKILLTLFQNYNTEQSSLLAKEVHSKMIASLSKNYSKIHDRKLRSALFYVLVGAKCPGILVETSYISNELEEKRLASSNYQKRLAEAIAEGVKNYVKSNPDQFASL